MDARLLDAVKREQDYAAWCGCRPGSTDFLAQGLLFHGEELPGYWAGRMQRLAFAPAPRGSARGARAAAPLLQSVARRGTAEEPLQPARLRELLPAPPGALRDAFPPGGAPATVEAAWKPKAGPPGVLLTTQVVECDSRLAAHDYLIRLIASFDSRVIRRRPAPLAGDVAFGGPQEAMLLFARGNLVVLIRNGGLRRIAVGAAARALDAFLTERPAAIITDLAATAPRAAGRRLRVEESVPLPALPAARAAATGEEGELQRYFAQGGSLYRSAGRVCYRPEAPGLHKVLIVPERARGRELRFEVVPGGQDE